MTKNDNPIIKMQEYKAAKNMHNGHLLLAAETLRDITQEIQYTILYLKSANALSKKLADDIVSLYTPGAAWALAKLLQTNGNNLLNLGELMEKNLVLHGQTMDSLSPEEKEKMIESYDHALRHWKAKPIIEQKIDVMTGRDPLQSLIDALDLEADSI